MTGYYYKQGEYPTPTVAPLRSEARCHCGQTTPSHTDLAFWQSAWGDTLACNTCGYYAPCHNPAHENHRDDMEHDFVPREPSEHDVYYCGHNGWD